MRQPAARYTTSKDLSMSHYSTHHRTQSCLIQDEPGGRGRSDNLLICITERSPATRHEPSDMVWVSPGLLIRSFRYHTSARATEPRRPSPMSLLTSAKAKSLG